MKVFLKSGHWWTMDTSIVAISGLPTSSKPRTPQLNGFIGTGVEPKTPKPPTNGFVVKAVISNLINVNTSDNVPNTPSGESSRNEQCAKENAITIPSDSPSTSLGVGDTNNNVGDGDGSTVEKKERKYRPRRRRFRRKMATNLPPCVISNRDPVSVLMEHGQTREVTVDFTECTRTGPAHNSRFHTAALVNGKRFAEGHGTSKKNAKKIAAELALDRLYKVASRNLASANEIVADRIENNEDENANDEPLSPAQKIKAMAKGVFELAEETQMIYYCKEKVVASFLMERCGQITVVALGTGNRSVLYQNLKTDGTCILQAHAEIVARRSFIRFLYNELNRFIDGESDAIFTLGTSGRLQLLDSVKFHLYISRPPCGDASAFPTIGSKDVRSKALRKQGVLRTLVADGEGAIPTDSILPAGHNGEERLRVMTCSDKICRWNVVGVQGALLSHIIEPIYLSKVVIGSYSGDQKEHVPRALFGRLQTGTLEEKIYNPYVVNVPSLYYPEDHDLDNYALNKSRQYSVVWTLGDDGVEVIDGIFGIKISGPTDMPYSAVSKKHFFTLFHELCQKFGRRDLLGKSYLQIKDKASEYRRNQDVLYQHFVSKKLGTWCSVSENYDVDNFYL